MCVSAAPAKFASTIVYGRATERRGQQVHVLGYQNVARNRAKGPNAMLLPIPSAAPMGPGNAIDARAFSGVLEAYRVALRSMLPVFRGIPSEGASAERSASVQVFDTGSYTVVLAHQAELGAIEAALAQVPAARRPSISSELIDAYRRWYPGWHLALCCFAAEGAGPEPMLWWYPPLDPSRVFLPGLDAHDGGVPQLGVQVEVDHAVALGVDAELPEFDLGGSRYPRWVQRPWAPVAKVSLPASLPFSLRSLFPPRVAGTASMSGQLENGDWYLPAQPDVPSLEAALGQRVRPPGA